MLQAFQQHLEHNFSSLPCTHYTPTPQRSSKKYRTIDDMPDEIIQKILEVSMMTPKHNLCQIRLVNKRLATLSLAYIFRTITVSSPEEFVQLCSAGYSPALNEQLGKHVYCFELAFMSRISSALDIRDNISSAFPNLKVVRFKFASGILIYAGESLQTLLTEDTLFRSSGITNDTDSSIYRFLAQLRPQRFEWVSPRKHDIYLVGVYRKLRCVFHSWIALTSVYLEGVCLVEQQCLGTWNFALFTDRVHIKGPFSSTEPVLLLGLQRMKDSSKCRHLLLEESRPADQCQQENTEEVPVLAYGNTMVSLKLWSALNRQRLKACASGRTLPPCVPRYSTGKATHVHYNRHSVRRPAVEFFFWGALCIFLLTLRVVGPQHILLGKMHLSLFDIFGGPYAFNFKAIYWVICHDGSYLGNNFCSNDSSIWFIDRSLMFHPT